MADVSRALMLPDIVTPSDATLKSAALYWDEIAVPDYVERLVDGGGPTVVSDAFERLEAAGVVTRLERRAKLPDLGEVLDGSWSSEEDLRAFLQAARHVRHRSGEHYGSGVTERHRHAMSELSGLAADLYLNRVHDALGLARAMHAAPMGHSPLSAIGATLGISDEQVPVREAALVSVTFEGFALDPETPVERIVAFREREAATLGRMRANLGELAALLSNESAPPALLPAARDIYRNRIVPALSQLEDAMNESALRFTVRSLVGATSLGVAGLSPVSAADQGLRLIRETVDYRFSRKRILTEHPLAYLHLARQTFGRSERVSSPELSLRMMMASPEAAIRTAMLSTVSPALVDTACVFCANMATVRDDTALETIWVEAERATVEAAQTADSLRGTPSLGGG